MAKGKRSIESISLKPNERWYASMSVRDQAGRRKREALGGFSTRAEADRAIARAAVAVESDTFVPRDRTPLETYLSDVWLPSIVAEVRETTYARRVRRGLAAVWRTDPREKELAGDGPNHPTFPTVRLLRLRGSDDLWAAECDFDYPGSEGTWRICALCEIRGGKIIAITEYFGAPFEAAEWRTDLVERISR